MGHREDLLEGAKKCLLEKGFVRTTARDVVAASGTNLASIGYHYGSKDELLAQAYVGLIEDIGDGWDELLDGKGLAAPRSLERFEEVWAKVLESFTTSEGRAVWMLTFEFVLQADRMPGVRQRVLEAQVRGRAGLVPMFTGEVESELDEEVVDTEGRLYVTLLNGLMVQWLFDPASATGADQLTAGLRRVIAGIRQD